ncbi:MAG: winged helix-turn-helix domain-containing protein [Candidatus Pacearchaeota archaeon]
MDYFKEITIINSKKLENNELNQEIQWISNCLGMFNKRDKEKSCFRIFINLLKEQNPISSDEIAERSNLSRGTVIHHISKLRDSGIVIKKDKGYTLKTRNFEELIEEIEKDVFNTMRKIKEVSKRIDERLEKEFRNGFIF